MSERTPPTFRAFLGAAGRLALGRQAAGLLFIAATLVLPNLTDARTVEAFVWAYYAMLVLTSVFGLGLERVAGVAVAQQGEGPTASIGPLVVLRLASVPVQALGLLALYRFVGVTLPTGAWWASLVWIVAAELQVVAFGGLRVKGNRTFEPRLYLGMRAGQCAGLLLLAASGFGATALVGLVALLEVVAAGWALRELLGRWRLAGPVRGLAWREIASFSAIELVALAYLRADVLLVGRMLGPEVGAAYGLAYRIVDGLNGLQGGVSLWLFAETLRGREGGDSPGGIRGRSLRVIPRVAALVCVVLIGGAGLLGRAVPDLRGTVPALRLLLVSLPLFVVSSVELHFRSARGRYREVLVAGSAALAANVVLVLWLVDAHGLEGAAWALLVSEGIQAVLLVAMSGRAERALVGGAAWRSATWTGLLLAVAVALNAGSPGVAAVAGPVLGLVVLGGALRDRASVPRVPATTRAPEAGHGGGGAASPASRGRRESAGTVAGGDPRVSVVILSWNDGELLERSVGSALSSRGARVEVVVVDNGSSPPVGIVAGEQVRVIRNERNRGVAAARNQGFAATSHELVCFLDSDACLVPDALSLMARALAADPTIALAAPVFRGQEPEDSAGRAPTLGRKVLRLAGARADYESAGQDGDAPSWDVDFAIGACQLVRREAFAAVGGLDESFFYGPEDVDFCLRLREAGWRVVQVRGAECDHPPRRRFRRIVSRRGLAHAWAVVRHLWRHRGFRRRMRARA